MPVSAAATEVPAEVIQQTPECLTFLPMLYRMAERFGLPVGILAVVLWWARTDVVQPLLEAHFGFINKVVEGQERHVEEVREVGKKIDRLIEITSKK